MKHEAPTLETAALIGAISLLFSGSARPSAPNKSEYRQALVAAYEWADGYPQ